MFCNFYGKVLLPPKNVEHTRSDLQLALAEIEQASEQHGIRDRIVAVEMTGTYHLPVKRAFRQAGWDKAAWGSSLGSTRLANTAPPHDRDRSCVLSTQGS